METVNADEAHSTLKRFVTGCNRVISHDSIDMVTLSAWCDRNRLEQIFESIEYIDSKGFYQYLMQQRGIRQSKMSVIVRELGWRELIEFYDQNSHGALSDAEVLCKLSTSKKLLKRFLGWKHFQLRMESDPLPDVTKRTQSLNRFMPG